MTAATIPPQSRQHAPAWRARVVVVAALTTGACYLVWRSTTLGSGWQAAWSVPLLLAEIWALAQLSLLAFQTWPADEPGPTGAVERAVDATDVDIAVVVTGDAAPSAVERSLVGAVLVRGRGRVVVVDRVDRAEVRSLVAGFGATYVVDTRAVASPAGAAHGHTSSALYVWLDAGQVPMPTLLHDTLGRFEDPSVAVCQVATGLLNADSLVHMRRGRDEQALLRDAIGPGLDRRGIAPWLGAGSIVRRRAIDDIGGPITSDLPGIEPTLVALYGAGWSTAFQHARLVRAVAPDTLGDYLRERRLRARAGLHVFRTPQNPLTAPGLTLAQRVAVVGSAAEFVEALRRLVLVAVLAITLLTGDLPFAAPASTVFAAWIVPASIAVLARRALSGGAMGLGDWSRHAWRTLGTDLAALCAVIGPQRVDASEREHRDTAGVRALGRLSLLTAVVIALDTALLIRAATLVDHDLLPRFSRSDRILVLGFGLILLLPMLDVLQVAVFRRQRRSHFRRPARLDVELGATRGITIDLAPTGVGVMMPYGPIVGSTTPIRLHVPTADGTHVWISGTAVTRAANPLPDGEVRVGLEFAHLGDDARRVLVEYCMLGAGAASDDRSHDLPLAEPPTLDLTDERHHVRLRGLTGAAAAAGLVTLFVGPVAGVAAANSTSTLTAVCVQAADGEPRGGAQIERLDDGVVTPLGVTEADGCLAVADLPADTAFALTVDGVRSEAATGVVTGERATFGLTSHTLRLLDSTGMPIAGVTVRHFGDRWHEGAPTDTAGEITIESPTDELDVDLVVAGGRIVRRLGPGTTDVVLTRIAAGPGIGVTDIDRGAGWEPFTDPMEVAEGRVALRLDDGSVVKLNLPAGHHYTVADDTLVPLQPAPAATPAPVPTAEEPTAVPAAETTEQAPAPTAAEADE